MDDFQKIDSSGRIERLYLHIPSQLSQTNNRYKPFQVLGKVDDNKLADLLNDMEDSKTVNFAFHSNDPFEVMSDEMAAKTHFQFALSEKHLSY